MKKTKLNWRKSGVLRQSHRDRQAVYWIKNNRPDVWTKIVEDANKQFPHIRIRRKTDISMLPK